MSGKCSIMNDMQRINYTGNLRNGCFKAIPLPLQ
ncbi:hypothetical protein FHS16_003224 [Paenibacillus endophyticus]|uniref:Uncharacterized protein n=1 Tax=Paenibacillus endophyticus TaxID=1294268 RepID=A0A7W5C9G2_9BACL|nr:hypothetical protein [Paenibacillus endophyticus]